MSRLQGRRLEEKLDWRPAETTVMRGARKDGLKAKDIAILRAEMGERTAARLAQSRFDDPDLQ